MTSVCPHTQSHDWGGGVVYYSSIKQLEKIGSQDFFLRRKASDQSIRSKGPSHGSKSCSVFEVMHPTTGLSDSPLVREVHWAALWGAQPSSLTKIKSDQLAG